jgi:hypothetical protein
MRGSTVDSVEVVALSPGFAGGVVVFLSEGDE